MTDKNKKWYMPESSTVAGIKGFAGPLMLDPGKNKKKHKKEYANLYSENFVDEIIFSELQNEVVKKRADGQWGIYDDETGAELSIHRTRTDAWNKQRQMRAAKASQEKAAGSERKRQQKSLTPNVAQAKPQKDIDKPKYAKTFVRQKAKVAPKPKTAKTSSLAKKKLKVKEQFIRKALYQALQEASMVSYIFENEPIKNSMWDNFIKKLSNDAILSDLQLKKTLEKIAKTETTILSKAANTIGEILKNTGAFEIKTGKFQKHEDTGETRLDFEIAMRENNKNLKFYLGLQNGKPLIIFPDEARNAINSMGNKESKLLRAELMHAQETALDMMDDVIKAVKSRDNYLIMMEKKLDKLLNDLGPVQIAVLKQLLKNKYKLKGV